MPKARRSTRNSDAMDAEGHEEVRRVFVFASSSCTFCLCVCLSFSFDDDVRVFAFLIFEIPQTYWYVKGID